MDTLQLDDERAPISGIWLPLVTPFREGRLDERSLLRLLRHYLGQPVDGLILAATTGEGLTLDEAETERLAALAAAEVAGRIPLYLGLSGSDTRKLAKTLAQRAAWPVEGYLIACPYYLRPSQEGLYRHFAALAEATDRPILIYNIPYRTGVNMTNETLLRLAELPNIIGLKDCAADAAQSAELLRRKPAGFSVLTGEDAQFHAALAQGADGGILAAAHLRTEGFARLRAQLLAGNNAAAREIWHGLIDLVRLLFAEPSPAPVKFCLWQQGLIASPDVRLPMTEVTTALAARLSTALTAAAAA
ncbi:MAG TPA: 4-hydroxy-tetrahydrodipicolinate synthase [Dongiaceae bacterium]|nr:4-hydroxy-tetrahydrodipicolinate synthase [Dongiaceae bacterium]